MVGSDRIVGNYCIEQFIGYGASSVVFEGHDVKCREHGVSKRVAVKFIWNRDMAREEVRRLERTGGVFEICDLITYDEIPGADIKEVIGETILQLERAMGCPLMIEDDQPVGVLVLKLINGEHLIDRTIYQDEPLDTRFEWTVDFDHPEAGETIILKEWLTPAARELDLEKRIEIITQLAKAIDGSHRKGVIHGDLNPWNVFYQAETGRISIIDLGRNNFGVQGWRSPEHWQLMTGEIGELPKETDIWLLGQWMRYLLPRKGPWATLVQRCFDKDLEKRPTARDIIKCMKRGVVRRPVGRLIAVASLFFFSVFIGIYAWQQRMPFKMSKGYNRIAVLSNDDSAVGKMIAEMVAKSLSTVPELKVIHDTSTRNVKKTSWPSDKTETEEFQRIIRTLGVQFVLEGTVTESETGRLTWTGTLLQQNGARRKLQSQGQNFLILADSIANLCIKLLGSTEPAYPSSEFFSNNLKANFLYSYGSEFFETGELNAAAAMFEKALKEDPLFHWAKAKLAFCDFRSGKLQESHDVLSGLVQLPDVLSNPRLLVTCYEFLAHIAMAWDDWDLAYDYVEEAKTICRTHELSENMGYILALDGLVSRGMGNYQRAADMMRESESIFVENGDHLGQIKTLIFQVIAEDEEPVSARKKLDVATQLAREYGLESLEARLVKAEAVYDLLKSKSEIKPDTLALLERARQLHNRIGDEVNVLDADYFIAYYYARVEEIEKARTMASRVLQLSQKRGVHKVTVQASLLLADLSSMAGNLDEAELYLKPLLDDRASERVKRLVYSRLWIIAAKRDRFDKAATYLEEGIAIAERQHDRRSISYAKNNLGELMERQGAFDTAWDYYQESLQMKREIKDNLGIAWTLRNLVILSIKLDRLDQAEKWNRELLELDPDSITTRLVLARLEYEKGRFDRAYKLISICKQEGIEKGLWRSNLEVDLKVYYRAFKENRYLDLPEQFGNY